MEGGFEWNEKKAASNLKKHGVSFEEAALAFYDPNALFWIDRGRSQANEEREICMGLTEQGILVVVFTERQSGGRIRVISARRANKKERAYYHEKQD